MGTEHAVSHFWKFSQVITHKWKITHMTKCETYWRFFGYDGARARCSGAMKPGSGLKCVCTRCGEPSVRL